ncbi:MAG: hypothetical protein K2K74_03365 [Lachnospiraceae bacterium]|nr:hypothetical protein [Lachnospiraceae bacterium]
MKKGISACAYVWISIVGILVVLLAFAGTTVYVDPLFHYHAPMEGLEYPLYDDQYMNDGIVKHFEYDAVITGSSMSANFKASLFGELFDTNAIKVPLYGASYCEINELLEQAFAHNDHITHVMRALDSTMLVVDKDTIYSSHRPEYLYDDDLLNDIEYVLNKDMYFKFTGYVFTYMRLGGKSTNFDVYRNYSGSYEYNGQRLKESYRDQRTERVDTLQELSEEDVQLLTENLEQNVLALVKAHPDTEFYLFFPPYSVLYFDDLRQKGELDKMLDAHEEAIELLLPYDNVHLYSFFDNFDLTCNLWNYSDTLHYNQDVCDVILYNMASEEGLLTEENYEDYLELIRFFYNEVDYDGFLYE